MSPFWYEAPFPVEWAVELGRLQRICCLVLPCLQLGVKVFQTHLDMEVFKGILSG